MAGSKVVECIGPSYHLADKKAAIQSAINCYPQRLDGDNWMLKSAPGMVETLAGEARGSKSLDDRWFVVADEFFYEVTTGSGGFANRGSLATTSGYVGIAVNGSQVAIVDGPNLYIYNYLTSTFTGPIVSAGWRGSDDVQEIDGYFVFVDPGTDQFYISAIDDGTSLDALDFSSADSSPDEIMTHRVNHRQLWLFGKSNSTEIWVNTGAAAFPFQRYQSYTLDVGCVGKRAAVNAADTLFWIGKTDRGTGIVYMAVGNQPQRVSTIAVEEALRSSTDLTQALMWSYQIEGHEFIGIEAPGLSTTWVYDAATQQWHERGLWSDGWHNLDLRFVTYFTLGATAQHWVGSSSQVYYMDPTLNRIGSSIIVRERTWPHLMQPSMEPTSFLGLEMAMASGSGGNVTLEISNDGGYTFGAPLLRSLGATGRWMQRIRWLGLGAAINRVFRIRCSDDVPFAIHSATVDTA